MLKYFKLDAWVVTLLRGDPYALAVLVHLMLHRNLDKDATDPQTHQAIAERVGISRPTVVIKLDKLKHLSLIEPVDAPKKRHSFQIVCIDNEPNIIQIPKQPDLESTEDTKVGWENFLSK